MKLVTFEVATPVGPVRRLGALLNGGSAIVDLNMAYVCYLLDAGGEALPYELADLRLPPDMIQYFKGGDNSKHAAQQAIAHVNYLTARGRSLSGLQGETVVYARAQVKLLAPVPKPNSMREFTTYLTHGDSEHARRLIGEMMGGPPRSFKTRQWYTQPACYKGNCSAVFGPEDDILWPRYSEKIDPEMELGFYIGKAGRNIPLEEAESYVAGYTMLVDVSARDVGMEFLGPYKAKDFCNIMGPCLVTPDEFDYRNARAVFRIDGEVVWEGNTGEPRSFLTHHLVAYASDSEMLYPGDFITGGTIGSQCSIDTNVWPKPGQTCEFEIEGIGLLKCQVVRPDAPGGWPRTGMRGELEFTGV